MYYDPFFRRYESVNQFPIERPTQLVSEPPYTCVEIPDEWLQYFLGWLEMLRQEDAWTGTQQQKEDMVRQTEALIERFSVGSACEERTIVVGARVGQIIEGLWDECPSGTLPMDGSDYDQDDYPELVAVLQQNTSLWASIGDQPSEGRFALPDLAAVTTVGHGYREETHPGEPTSFVDFDVGDTGGETRHQTQVSEMPAHSHFGVYTRTTAGTQSRPKLQANSQEDSTRDFLLPTGGGTSHNNLPPFIAVRKCIIYSLEEFGSMFKLRQSPADDCILEQSFDNEIWTPAFDFSLCAPRSGAIDNITLIESIVTSVTTTNNDYDGTVLSIEPELVYGDADDDLRDYGLCTAIYLFTQAMGILAAEVVREQYKETGDLFNNLGDLLGRVGGAISALPAPGAWGAYAKALGAGITAAGGAAEVIAILFDAAADGVEWDDPDLAESLSCCVYDELKEGTLTPARWAYAWGSCAPETGVDDIWHHRIVSAVATKQDSYLMFIRAWAEMLDLAKTGAGLPCPCTDEVCETSDFTQDFISNWQLEELTIHVPGQGLLNPYPVPGNITAEYVTSHHCGAMHSLPLGLTLTRVRVHWISPRNDDDIKCVIQVINSLWGITTLLEEAEQTEDATIETEWNGEYLIVPGDKLRVLADASSVTDKPGNILDIQFCYELLST